MTCFAYLALLLTGRVADDQGFPSIETIRTSYLSGLTTIVTLDCEIHLDPASIAGP
jgi:hypothetical protein